MSRHLHTDSQAQANQEEEDGFQQGAQEGGSPGLPPRASVKPASVLRKHDVVIPPVSVRFDGLVCGTPVGALPGELIVAHLVLGGVHRLSASHEALDVAKLVLLLTMGKGCCCGSMMRKNGVSVRWTRALALIAGGWVE